MKSLRLVVGLVALGLLTIPRTAHADYIKPFWVDVKPGTSILSCPRPDCSQIAYDATRPELLRAILGDTGTKLKVSRIEVAPNCYGGGCVFYKVSDLEEQYIPQSATQEWPNPLPITQNPCSVPNCVAVDLANRSVHLISSGVDVFSSWASTGLPGYGTPLGEHHIDRRFETKRMVSPFVKPGVKGFYDLSGIPWNMRLAGTMVYLHGTYWHAGYGERHSHGCVNLTDYDAKFLYDRTSVGSVVFVGNHLN